MGWEAVLDYYVANPQHLYQPPLPPTQIKADPQIQRIESIQQQILSQNSNKLYSNNEIG